MKYMQKLYTCGTDRKRNVCDGPKVCTHIPRLEYSAYISHSNGDSILQLVAVYYSEVDWCCFYYLVRNSLEALMEALCARSCSVLQCVAVCYGVL